MLNDFSLVMLAQHGLFHLNPVTKLSSTQQTSQPSHERHTIEEHEKVPIVTLISRRKRRQILNEAQLITAIQSKWKDRVGVIQIHLEEFNFHEQMQIIRSSAILIGMHGAGFVHELWMADGAGAIELFPFKYYKPTYQVIANMVRLDLFLFVRLIDL